MIAKLRSRGSRTMAASAALGALLLPLGVATVAEAAPALPVVDDFEEPLFTGTEGDTPIGFFTATDPQSSTTFERTATLPELVPDSSPDNEALRTDFDVTSFGVVIHSFADEATSTWVNQDWSSYAGLQFWMYGTGSGTDLFVDVMDNRSEGSTTDDAERFSVPFTDDTPGWRLVQLPFDEMSRKEIGNGAPNDGFQLTQVHGWAFGSLATDGVQSYYLDDIEVYGVAPERPLTVGFTSPSTTTTEGEPAQVGLRLSKTSDAPVEVSVRTTQSPAREGIDYTAVDTRVTLPAGQTAVTVEVPTVDDAKYQGERIVLLEIGEVTGADLGQPPGARVVIADDESADPTLIEDFERTPYLWDSPTGDDLSSVLISPDDPLALPDQSADEGVLSVDGFGAPVAIRRQYALPQDWSERSGLSMWYYGAGSGEQIDLTLTNPTVGAGEGDSAGWDLAWSDEFEAAAGTAPDPDAWTHEIGDGTVIGKPGWGNDERQYYTDSTDNAAHDGAGNLVITTREITDGSGPQCYYGPCEYTSARLVTQDKVETAYGRIEARVRVPVGQGLWPAFWSLGTDIIENPWPQAGEIDVMEHVGREPNRVFGTIHGPGYSGGQSFGNDYVFDVPVAQDFHEYAVEWRPEEIVWEVDGIRYHEAVPADVDPSEWVFEHPFFLLLNTAIGGNFGGTIGDIDFPQTTTVDYVRVYQANPQNGEFGASFTDDTAGWKQLSVPFSEFVNAQGTPVDAAQVNSLSLQALVPEGERLLLDQIRLDCASKTAVVDSAADAGAGSLRAALTGLCPGGTITVDPALAGQTIALDTALSVEQDVNIDASAAPGLTLDGQGSTRVLEVSGNVRATATDLIVTDGYGYELAGGILNNGDLTLDRVEVSGNGVQTSGNDFWKGGGGIYTGEGASLTLVDSTVADNVVEDGPGGGLYAFFGSKTTIQRSTISDNTASDVGAGLRLLGDATITNSTLSDNTSQGWHGGALFATDGSVEVVSSTVVDNTSPEGTSGAMFVGTFGDTSADLSIIDSIVVDNSGVACVVVDEGAGSVTLTSGGRNVTQDQSCGEPAAGDLVASEPVVGELADNGGPTLTHAPVEGSVALDHGDRSATLDVDQRGVARPQGPAPDAGSVEVVVEPASSRRLAGTDRFETAATVAMEFGKVDVVYVASGLDFPDALTAQMPAGSAGAAGTQETSALGAPVLLTRPEQLPGATRAALADLAPEEIRIIGGTAAVSVAVQDELRAFGTVTRYGGDDRYETSAAVAALFPAGLPVVYVATGVSFPDALVGGSVAAREGAPVLLTRDSELSPATYDALKRLDPQSVVVIGGEQAVSPAVQETIEQLVPGTSRVFGADRYATAAALAEAHPAHVDVAFLASGQAFPDALVGGSLAGARGAPMLLTRPDHLPDATWSALERLSPASVTIFGGDRAVGEAVQDRLDAALPGWAATG